jgi:hypothetical protein
MADLVTTVRQNPELYAQKMAELNAEKQRLTADNQQLRAQVARGGSGGDARLAAQNAELKRRNRQLSSQNATSTRRSLRNGDLATGLGAAFAGGVDEVAHVADEFSHFRAGIPGVPASGIHISVPIVGTHITVPGSVPAGHLALVGTHTAWFPPEATHAGQALTLLAVLAVAQRVYAHLKVRRQAKAAAAEADEFDY